MEIREAVASDLDAVVGFVPERNGLFSVFPQGRHPFSVEQLLALTASRSDLSVAVEGGRVVGFADLHDVRKGGWAYVGHVVVDREFQHQGIGRTLVSYMSRLAFVKYDVQEVRLSVFNTNTRALLLYTAMDFMPFLIEERIDPSGEPVGLIHMRYKRR